MKSKFYIDYFPDYHDIRDRDGYKAIELGCFPPKNRSYCYYFGLFYTEDIPSLTEILSELHKMIDNNYVSWFPNHQSQTYSKLEVERRIKESIKSFCQNK